MIYVSEDQLNQVEYLIAQSIIGNHVLFDSSMIHTVFEKFSQEIISEEDAYSVEHHIERLILQPTLAAKRAYLEGLDHRTLGLVIRTYFNIVENNLYENLEVKH